MNPSAGGKPHPRACGTFPRVLGHYVREEKVLSLEEAIRKMASLPARRLVRDYERQGATAECFIYLSMGRLMVRRLAKLEF